MMEYGAWRKGPEDLDTTRDSGLAKIYEFFWRRLGGRPFTFRIRDWWHQYPLIWIFALAGLGVGLGHLFW